MYRPSSSSAAKSQASNTPLKVIHNGSVVSRARSSKAESVAASTHKLETRSVALTPEALSAVEEAYRSVKVSSTHQYNTTAAPVQQPVQQPVYVQAPPPKQLDNGGKAAKAIIGTLLGATAGAAIAYALVKGDSSDIHPSPPPSVPVNTAQYVPQPSMPAIMEAPYPPQSHVHQQIVYRALEAPPARSAYSERSRDDGYLPHPRSVASKNPRADTIYEGGEGLGSVDPRDIVYPEGYSPRRASEGGSYMDLPIRAIEYSPPKSRAMSYSYPASTLISSFVEKERNREIEDYESVRENSRRETDRRSEYSSSTIKPAKPSQSHVSSHKSSTSTSHYSKSSKRYHTNPPSHASSRHSGDSPRELILEEINEDTPSKVSSTRKVRNVSSGSTSEHSTTHTHKSKNTVVSTTSKVTSKSSRSARNLPLPDSAAASTVFLDAVDQPAEVDVINEGVVYQGELSENDEDVTPEDSISQVGTTTKSPSRSHHHHHRSSHHSTVSKKSNGSSKSKRSSSKFDEPIKPSDSVSQVSANTASKHTSSRVGSKVSRHSRAA